MRMNPNIPMGVQPFNAMAALSGGAQAAGQVNAVQRENSLARIQDQFAEGIVRGDQNALAQLARFDPTLARNIQQQVETNQRADRQFEYGQQRDAVGDSQWNQRFEYDQGRAETADNQWGTTNARLERAEDRAQGQYRMLEAQEARQIEEQARNLSAADAAAEAERLQRAALALESVQSEEQYEALVQRFGVEEQFAGQYANRRQIAEFLLDSAEVMDLRAQDPSEPEPLTDEGKRTVDIRGGFIDPNAPPAPADVPAAIQAKEAQIARLMEFYPREIAVGIADGVFAEVNDGFGGVTIVNRATGETVSSTEQRRLGPAQGQPEGQPQGAPTGAGAGFPADAPLRRPVPTGAEDAFGAEGMIRRGINATTDFVGAGEVFDEAAEQTRFFDVLREDLTNSFGQTYNRQPATQFMVQIQKLMPTRDDGPDAALGKLNALKDRFETDIESFERSLRNRRLRPVTQEQIESDLAAADRALVVIDRAIRRFGNEGGGGSTTSTGVQWRVVE